MKYLLCILCGLTLFSCINRADIYFKRGDYKNASNDFNAAIIEFNKGLEIDSNHIRCIVGRGISKSNLWDFEGAIED